MLRVPFAMIDGPPSGPGELRVSIMRQGVTLTSVETVCDFTRLAGSRSRQAGRTRRAIDREVLDIKLVLKGVAAAAYFSLGKRSSRVTLVKNPFLER